MQTILDLVKGNKQKLKPLGFFFLTVLGLYGINTLFKQKSDNSDQQQQQDNSRQPAGIMNQGNTCFVNSLLQSLASCQSFILNIQQLLKIKSISDQNQQLIKEFYKVLKMINSNKSQSISVMDFLTIFSKTTESNIINFQQQDTYQLYSGIVRSFDQFFNKRKQANLSVFSSIFTLQNSINKSISIKEESKKEENNTEENNKQIQIQKKREQQQVNDLQSQQQQQQQQIQNSLIGYTKSTIQCTSCKNTTTIKIHSFYDLSLQIQPPFITSLKAALLWYQRSQKIQSYTCTNCSIRSHISKLQIIEQQLNNNKNNNNNEEIKYNHQLSIVNKKILTYLKKKSLFEDMQLKEINYMLEKQVIQFTDIFEKTNGILIRDRIFSLIKPVQRQIIKQTKITKYPKVLVIHFKQLIINPYTSEPAYMKKPIDYPLSLQLSLSSNRKKTYKLTSLLTHIGNQMMGHYFTFRLKNRFQNIWYLISDSHTQQCSENKMKRYVPYMLFYQLDQDVIIRSNQNIKNKQKLIEKLIEKEKQIENQKQIEKEKQKQKEKNQQNQNRMMREQ